MRPLTQDEIQILQRHAAWVRGEEDGVRADLSGTDLSGTDLSGTNLYKANLSEADLSGTDLSGADLRGTNLYKANLSEADLSGTDLYKANLSGTNLSGTDLSGTDLYKANLSEADLSGADLSGANLRGAKGIMLFGPIGSRAGITYAVRGRDTMIKCGCFWGTLDAWDSRCRAVHGDTPHGKAYAAATEFIRAYAAAYWTEDDA